jgi:hypothetical protein
MKGYRTLLFNLLALAPLCAEIFLELAYSQEVQFFITEEMMPIFMVAVIVCNILLRFVTTTPVGRK